MRNNSFGSKILILFFIVFFTNTLSLVATTNSDSLILGTYFISTADRLYESQELPGNLELALAFYKKAQRHNKTNQTVEWKIARCYWALASKALSPLKRTAYYKEGIRFGNEAVKKYPTSSYAHAWLSLNIGSSALNDGVVKTLYKREIIKSGFENALKLNPENSVAKTGLATWYHYVPAFLGGDQQKAIQLINQVITLAPDYLVPRMLKAEFLISTQQYSKAKVELEALLAVTNPDSRWEGTENQYKAKALLLELKERDPS